MLLVACVDHDFLCLRFRIFILVTINVTLHVLVLFEQEPKHLVHLLRGLNRHFLIPFHTRQFPLQILDALDVRALELTLIRHDEFKRTYHVLLQLVVEGLSRNLHTDAKHDRCVDYLLLQGRI
jgi:hypothetical protein